jgi:hypothetical protein
LRASLASAYASYRSTDFPDNHPILKPDVTLHVFNSFADAMMGNANKGGAQFPYG